MAVLTRPIAGLPPDPASPDVPPVGLYPVAMSGQSEQADLEAAAKSVEKVKPFLDGKTIKKIIVVPKKLVNIVVA